MHWRLLNKILAQKLWFWCDVSFVCIMVVKNLLAKNGTANKPQISSTRHHHITMLFMCNIMKHNIFKLGCNIEIYHWNNNIIFLAKKLHWNKHYMFILGVLKMFLYSQSTQILWRCSLDMCFFVQMAMVMSFSRVLFIYLKRSIIKKMMIMCLASI